MSSSTAPVALINGASQGIGEAIAHALARLGMNLVLTSRSAEKLANVEADIRKACPGVKTLVIPCDTRNHQAVVSVVEKTLAELGQIDILINNAGIAGKIGLFQEVAFDDIDATIDTNLKGPMYFMKAVLPHMVARSQGTIININSVAGKTAFPFWGVYCASKFGLSALTESVSEEQRPNGIRVVGIHPGAVDTPIWDDVDRNAHRERMLHPQDVANAVVYVLQQPANVHIPELVVVPTKPAL
jgi:NADP-dependent 3-hydroxy acid dehydrogenase YdfG